MNVPRDADSVMVPPMDALRLEIVRLERFAKTERELIEEALSPEGRKSHEYMALHYMQCANAIRAALATPPAPDALRLALDAVYAVTEVELHQLATGEPVPADYRKARREAETGLWLAAREHAYEVRAQFGAAAVQGEAVDWKALYESEERNHGHSIDSRDRFHEKADALAQAISEYFGVDVGEHSSANCPWDEALAAIGYAKPYQHAATPLAKSDGRGTP